MTNDISSKISQAIEILKLEIREDKARDKSLGKIFNKYGNDCYIYSILEEVGITNFESNEEMIRLMNKVKEEVAKEIVRTDTDGLKKCEFYKFEKK